MIRQIKFRGKCVSDSKYAYEWVEGGYVPPSKESANQEEGLIMVYHGNNCTSTYHVICDTVGEFTGLKDKNGVDIYEGDIVCYYTIATSCINPDCDPFNYIYESYVKKVEGIVEYVNGSFFVEADVPLCYAGLDDLEGLKECLDVEKEDDYCDFNGTKIDESVLGIEVIGNIYDNQELLNNE